IEIEEVNNEIMTMLIFLQLKYHLEFQGLGICFYVVPKKVQQLQIILKLKHVEQLYIANDLRNLPVAIYRPHVSSIKETLY
ncbi:hypothetical protein M8C21_011859, partial [Ambrosia artemisiifolia]